MLSFTDVLQSEYANEYESEYDLTMGKKFSGPKIYTAKGDLDKRWYVYFSYADPQSGNLKRQKPIYGTVNQYKTKEERMAVLSVYRKIVLNLLKEGYSPYEDNTERFRSKTKIQEQSKPVETKTEEKPIPKVEEPKPKAEAEEFKGIKFLEALKLDRTIKERMLKPSSKRSYFSHIKIFQKWVQKNRPDVRYINQVDKRMVIDFLNYKLEDSSPRNRNNYRTSLSALMQNLVDNDILEKNIVSEIKVLKAIPTRNKSYSQDEHESIFKHLEEKDPMLLLFIKFVSYNFLRPIEVCRLKVSDINLKERTLSIAAKNKPLKTKIIPRILIEELPELKEEDKDKFLFTPQGLVGSWDIEEENKRTNFGKRFKKMVKDPFGLGEEYGMYSFRHTFITKLYRSLVKESNPYVAKGELMSITGHTSMRSLEFYLRDIDAELPSDYSDKLIS